MDNAWTKASTMPREYQSAASAFHPSWGIIMNGGICYDCSDEVTLTKDAAEFYNIEPVPIDGSDIGSCVAAINSNMIFTTALKQEIGAGNEGQNKTFMYYKDLGAWVPLPDMPTSRSAVGCGVARDANGNAEVVVVGGVAGVADFTDTVEIFNVKDESWRTGEFFEQELH